MENLSKDIHALVSAFVEAVETKQLDPAWSVFEPIWKSFEFWKIFDLLGTREMPWEYAQRLFSIAVDIIDPAQGTFDPPRPTP